MTSRLRNALAVALSVSLVPPAVRAQAGLTPEQAVAMRQPSNVQLSPDGKWVAYTVTTANLKESSTNPDLWIVPAAGGDPVRLTNHAGRDDQARWAPDSRSLAFVSSRDGTPQVYRLTLPGGEPEQLTKTKSGVHGFAWSPDGTRLAYVTQRALTDEEEEKKKAKDDAVVIGRDWIPVRLVVLDLATSTTTDIATAQSILGMQWSPDGAHIAYTVAPSPKADDFRNTDIMIVDVAASSVRTLVDNAGPDVEPSWSPDGRLIAFLTKGPTSPTIVQSRLAVVPAAGGTPRVLGGDFLYEPGPATWSRDGASLYFWAPVRTRNELFQQRIDGGTAKQVSDLGGTTGLFPAGAPSISADETIIAYNRSATDTPDEITVARLQAPWKQVALTALNPELTSVKMGRGEVVRWKGKDGMEIEGIVVYPIGYQPGKSYPTVAIIHGGPSGVWNETFGASWYNSAQVYAGSGWVAFLPNIRGSSAYGEKFLAANYRDWGNGDYHDVQTGLDELVRRGIADSTRLAQTGWSYGGYMTAWTLTQTNRFKALMVGAGLTNMYSMYSTNDLQSVLEDYFGAEPWDDEQAYRRASAMMSIKKAKTPTLILHGQADTRVPIGQAQELYMGLKKNDVPVELVFFPREPHGLQEPRHMLDKINREVAFFSRYVLGTEGPDKVVQ